MMHQYDVFRASPVLGWLALCNTQFSSLRWLFWRVLMCIDKIHLTALRFGGLFKTYHNNIIGYCGVFCELKWKIQRDKA